MTRRTRLGSHKIRLPKPDHRARLDYMPDSDVPVIRQPYQPGDLLALGASGRMITIASLEAAAISIQGTYPASVNSTPENPAPSRDFASVAVRSQLPARHEIEFHGVNGHPAATGVPFTFGTTWDCFSRYGNRSVSPAITRYTSGFSQSCTISSVVWPGTSSWGRVAACRW